MAYKKIGDYGLIGNTKTAALVGTDGSIDWFCYPHFDSPSIFGAILDDKKGGRFQINPTEEYLSTQKYLNNTNILETTFLTDEGKVKVTDFMPVFKEDDDFITMNGIYRVIEGIDGAVKVRIFFDPKPDYARDGRMPPNLKLVSNLVENSKSVDKTFEIKNGQKYFVNFTADPLITTGRLLDKTKKYWQKIAQGITYEGRFRDAVVRSSLVLHLLFYTPTGAIVASPTTSLPERIGGPRNWDYRYAWLRDAAFTMQALFSIGDFDEALAFFSWLTTLCANCGVDVKVMYTLNQKEVPNEKTLDHLEGYQKSKPVRIGNAAHTQFQLDVFGEIVDAAYVFYENGGQIDGYIWTFLKGLVDGVCTEWRRKDKGIWEVRSGPHHFLLSKVMVWVALDRGIKMAEELDLDADVVKWKRTRDEVKAEVLKKGWSKKVKSFTQHYETEALDSSILLASLVGFIDAWDPKMISTIRALMSNLEENRFILRYRPEKAPDGLAGTEGVFLAPNFWLVQNFILLGELEEATKMYERLLSLGNHLGLFAEMVDLKTGGHLGNFPQALTHLEVIITASYLKEAGIS